MTISECLFIYLWDFPICSEFFGPTRSIFRRWWLCSSHPATPRNSCQPSPWRHTFLRLISAHRGVAYLGSRRGNRSSRQSRRWAWRVHWRAGRTGVVLIRVAFRKMKWLFNFLRKILIVIITFWTSFDRKSVPLYVSKLPITFYNFLNDFWSSIGPSVCHQSVSHFSQLFETNLIVTYDP